MKKLWDFAWEQYRKHEEGINYLIFGFLAFVLNYVLYFVFASMMQMHYMLATAVSWVLTVVFAVMTVRQAISQDFMTIYAVIIAFYFGTQSQKVQDAMEGGNG